MVHLLRLRWLRRLWLSRWLRLLLRLSLRLGLALRLPRLRRLGLLIRIRLVVTRLLIRVGLLIPRLLIGVRILRVLLAPGRLLSWPHGQ
ncbi:hypothetical protein AB4212_14955 [Streptomyces sp. 2MCAF27]